MCTKAQSVVVPIVLGIAGGRRRRLGHERSGNGHSKNERRGECKQPRTTRVIPRLTDAASLLAGKHSRHESILGLYCFDDHSQHMNHDERLQDPERDFMSL